MSVDQKGWRCQENAGHEAARTQSGAAGRVGEGLMRSGKGLGGVFFGRSKGWPAQADGDAMVLEAVDHGVHEGFSLEEAVPFGIVKAKDN